MSGSKRTSLRVSALALDFVNHVVSDKGFDSIGEAAEWLIAKGHAKWLAETKYQLAQSRVIRGRKRKAAKPRPRKKAGASGNLASSAQDSD